MVAHLCDYYRYLRRPPVMFHTICQHVYYYVIFHYMNAPLPCSHRLPASLPFYVIALCYVSVFFLFLSYVF